MKVCKLERMLARTHLAHNIGRIYRARYINKKICHIAFITRRDQLPKTHGFEPMLDLSEKSSAAFAAPKHMEVQMHRDCQSRLFQVVRIKEVDEIKSFSNTRCKGKFLASKDGRNCRG